MEGNLVTEKKDYGSGWGYGGFALLVVLFILLIIIGASCFGGGGSCG
ncbi:TPA: YjcZ family sporulation protein [Bacillus cereus]|nr:YjcZ family sporulation protein [Bacillus cereus]HEE9032260.1 YjcZ family sporulation protein [Bacillus cereus]